MFTLSGGFTENININLKNVSETLLVPLYVRYVESIKKNPYFIDRSAIEIVENSDYDFMTKVNNKMNINGCIAKTIIFYRKVSKYIKENPECTVINLGCGLDDRFNRVDNGKIRWYNIDIKPVIDLRDKLIEKKDRYINIASSILESSYLDKIENKENVLVIAEGLLMYFTEDEVIEIFNMIIDSSEKCTFIVELMSKWMVEHQNIHDTVKTMAINFKWGIKDSKDVTDIIPRIKLYGDYNITPLMKKLMPFIMTLASPFMYNKNDRVACFIKK